MVKEIEQHESCRTLTLSDPHAPGTAPFRIIHPFDDLLSVQTCSRPRRVGIRAWRRACRSLLAQDGEAWSLRTAASSRIELLPYQLEPTLALLLGLGSRILIADDVGLGKTVQAMMAVAELRARGVVTRVLIACPAGLREQWADECSARFDLPLTVLDHAGLRRVRARLPPGVNPWTIEPLVVSSVDYIKRPEVLPAVLEAPWDVVIVDEAHGASGRSERCDAVSQLCRRALYVLLLTATPHSGDEESFAALCGLGRHDDGLVVFRRTRLEAGRDAGRRVHTVRVRATAAEQRMHAALAALTEAVRRESTEHQPHVWLMLALLHKRALSSAYALAASAERRLEVLGDGCGADPAAQLLLPLDDGSGELDSADAAPMWSAPALRDTRQERRLLQQVADAAREAQGCEGKLHRLRRLLRAVREPVIVFTEFRDTLMHVRSEAAPHASIIHGGMTREQRRAALNAFPSTGVLLATDAAGEGLNLQEHCRCVINLELPWNPMRLEQRIGRVDRIGQRRRVHVFYLVAEGTGEVRLLARLTARVSHASARLTAPDPLRGRPAWTEEASARLVIMGEEQHGPADPPGSPPGVLLTRLDPQARREAARLHLVRALALPPTASVRDTAAGNRPPIAWTRRGHVRAALRGGTLAVYTSQAADESGHVIATRVHGVLTAAIPSDRAALTQLGAPPPSPDADRWAADSLAAHHTMTMLRVRRARAIAAPGTGATGGHQPGLFDRRVEVAWRAEQEEREAVQAWAADAIARAEARLRVTVSAPQLAAALVSCRRGPGP